MKEEKKKTYGYLLFPILFVAILWVIKIIETIFNIDLSFLGVYPLKLSGLIGIITAPIVHANFAHLIANSIPLLVLTACLFYFYYDIAYITFFLLYIIPSIWVWFFARDAYHIGASGVIYGLASFLFVSGLIRRNHRLMALSLLVVFLYGGIIWGVFPYFTIDATISWESHLMGLIAGIILAIYFRKSGPPADHYEWEDEEMKPSLK